MAQFVLTRSQSRQVDERAEHQWGISSLVLMENAGRAAADGLCRLNPEAGKITIFCGKGNNGGDGFVMARHLHLRGLPVQVLLFHDPQNFSSDALANFEILQKCGMTWHCLFDLVETDNWNSVLDTVCLHSTWLVDALLGTGSSGPPRSPLDQVIDWMNQATARRLALDIPSGLDCDTAQVTTMAVQADQTFTFAAAKPGLLMERAVPYVGNLEVLDIGLPLTLLESCANGHEDGS
ncbi:MAG TPA: NAD(P)H-hydrate epimerase [Planctomycetes bacterium]|nr:NAD(P)H-hydrate epimerase [Planctomycetota bacterium]